MGIDKDFYNQSSAAKLGWDPSWFDCDAFDAVLVSAVKKWQKSYGLTADGLVGPLSYRRKWTEREAEIDEYKPVTHCKKDKHFIVHNSKFLPIKWDKVVLWSDDGGLKSNAGTYYDYAGKPDRLPTHFVNHWDVCLSSTSCARVLNKRGISVHFLIDNDGTIYQMLDTQHGGWHAGNIYGNKRGIGVEISNAYYLKYQPWYVKNGFGERPVMVNAEVHGGIQKPFLGFYGVQLEALKALWNAIHEGLGVPLDCPLNSNGTLNTGVDSRVTKGKFAGFVNHYNFTRRKIDCAGLDLVALLDEVKND